MSGKESFQSCSWQSRKRPSPALIGPEISDDDDDGGPEARLSLLSRQPRRGGKIPKLSSDRSRSRSEEEEEDEGPTLASRRDEARCFSAGFGEGGNISAYGINKDEFTLDLGDNVRSSKYHAKSFLSSRDQTQEISEKSEYEISVAIR